MRALAPSLGLHVPSSVPVEVLARLIAEKRQGTLVQASLASLARDLAVRVARVLKLSGYVFARFERISGCLMRCFWVVVVVAWSCIRSMQ